MTEKDEFVLRGLSFTDKCIMLSSAMICDTCNKSISLCGSNKKCPSCKTGTLRKPTDKEYKRIKKSLDLEIKEDPKYKKIIEKIKNEIGNRK